MLLRAIAGFALTVVATSANAQSAGLPVPDYGADLQRFEYPAPVHWFETQWETGPIRMAYLDLTPERHNGRTVVLLHGKNFCAATWYDSAKVLVRSGYRVISPDQVGFC